MRINKSCIYLAIALFPVFGIEVVDKTGLIESPEFSSNKVLRLSWFLLLVVIGVDLLRSKVTTCLNDTNKKLLFLSVIVVFSILVNTLYEVLAWYRAAELLVALFIISSVFEKCLRAGGDVVYLYHRAVFVVALLSIIVIILVFCANPDLAWVTETQKRTRLGGYVYSPNMLGAYMAFGISSSMVLMFSYSKRILTQALLLLSGLLFLLAILLTGSRTSLGLLGFLCIASLYSGMSDRIDLRGKALVVTSMLLAVFLILLVFYLNFDALMLLIGKGQDPIRELATLNNRTVVFGTALESIAGNPFTGVGYVVGVENYFKENFPQAFWLPPHSHNGFLEVVMAFGVMFGSLIVLVLLRTFFRQVKQFFSSSFAVSNVNAQFAAMILLAMTTVPFGNVYGPTCGVIWLSYLMINRIELK